MSNKKITLAEKMLQLQQMVDWFENESFVLDEALERFKEAELLAKEIEAELLELKNKVVVLTKKFDQE
ncbi:MAG: hypothetical protein WAQ25_04555 [Candidatus Saccharimonas sp.]